MNEVNEIKIVNNGPITASELRGVMALARTNENCKFNAQVKEIYDEVLIIIMRRATEGYSDYNINSGNTPWCGKPGCTEALRKVAEMLAVNHKLNVTWYWEKDENYCCHSIHIDWEEDGIGQLKIKTI